MSKLDILHNGKYPRVIKKLHLDQYDAQFRGNYVEVWLNWSSDFFKRVQETAVELAQSRLALAEARAGTEVDQERVDECQAALDLALQDIYAANAEMWNCEPGEVEQIADLDIELYGWLTRSTTELREAFRERQKKVA